MKGQPKRPPVPIQNPGDDQPEYAAEKITVVDLPETRKEKTQHRRRARFVPFHMDLDGASARQFERNAAEDHEEQRANERQRRTTGAAEIDGNGHRQRGEDRTDRDGRT